MNDEVCVHQNGTAASVRRGRSAVIHKVRYDARGKSYRTAWASDWFRLRHVTGDTSGSDGSESKPIKSGEIARSPANKLIQGDWQWVGLVTFNSAESSDWHLKKGRANLLSVIPTLCSSSSPRRNLKAR